MLIRQPCELMGKFIGPESQIVCFGRHCPGSWARAVGFCIDGVYVHNLRHLVDFLAVTGGLHLEHFRIAASQT